MRIPAGRMPVPPLSWNGKQTVALRAEWRDRGLKITHNLYDPEVSPELRYYPKSNTTGNKYKLLNHTFHYDTRKYSFTARIVMVALCRADHYIFIL